MGVNVSVEHIYLWKMQSQMGFNPWTSDIASYRSTNWVKGDLQQQFEEESNETTTVHITLGRGPFPLHNK